jgi:hypothetical protein
VLRSAELKSNLKGVVSVPGKRQRLVGSIVNAKLAGIRERTAAIGADIARAVDPWGPLSDHRILEDPASDLGGGGGGASGGGASTAHPLIPVPKILRDTIEAWFESVRAELPDSPADAPAALLEKLKQHTISLLKREVADRCVLRVGSSLSLPLTHSGC